MRSAVYTQKYRRPTVGLNTFYIEYKSVVQCTSESRLTRPEFQHVPIFNAYITQRTAGSVASEAICKWGAYSGAKYFYGAK